MTLLERLIQESAWIVVIMKVVLILFHKWHSSLQFSLNVFTKLDLFCKTLWIIMNLIERKGTSNSNF